ncbi:MAG: slipin family protein [Candidatus Aureabacteria bacterium]|nr:slipin family protein [Candidatus Auribacterota bacterium]
MGTKKEVGVMIFLGIAIALIVLWIQVRSVTVFEYEKGVKYSFGRFKKILSAGKYFYIRYSTTIRKVDVRPMFILIKGQEILSSDGVALKMSIAAQYEIRDLNVAINKVGGQHIKNMSVTFGKMGIPHIDELDTAGNKVGIHYEEALHIVLQLTLREIIGLSKIEDILIHRDVISQQLMEKADKKVAELGLKLISANIKDIMFPGELKKIFAQVTKARQEGLALLEKARGETAALRNLNNSAKFFKDNPALMQLRALYSSGTIVLSIPGAGLPFPINDKGSHNSEGTRG